ncbi:MAG: hypothetical protein J5939_00770 [Bacteroidales bacterium]|nr:hypothetical protein [Bacteroidales bacterium]
MKRLSIILGVLAAVAATSCNKESPEGPAGKDGLCSVTISIGMERPVVLTTKADAYSASEEDDFIDRLDMFEYDNTGVLVNRKTWENPSGLDLSSVSYTGYSEYNKRRYWLFMANFDEESVEFLASLDGTQIGRAPYSVIPLEAGNFRLHKPLMGGGASYQFSKDGTTTATLYRYMTKFELGTITADFDDSGYLESDVKLKKIAITHVPNFLRPFYRSVTNVFDHSQIPLGLGYSYPNGGKGSSIGNLGTYNTGVNSDVRGYTATGTFNPGDYGATGALDADFTYAYNYNKGAAKGVLTTDAPGDMLTATTHTFGASEGILCKSNDEDWPHTYSINKVLYTIPWYRYQYGYLWGTESSQDDTQKMVFQIEIDGKDYFYIIPMRELEANMIYKLNNISIKGLGSEYCNFYPRKYAGEINPISVAGWTDCEIDNIDMGYKDYLGTEIY